MKLFRILGRTLSDAVKSVGRNFSLSFASIICITITLILVAVSILLSYNVNNFTRQIEEDVTIVVFVENDATDQEIQEIKNKILAIENVVDNELVHESKEKVRKEMAKESDVFKAIMNQYTAETNPLQDSFQVKVHNIEEIKETSDEISKFKHVALTKYGEGMVEELVKIFKLVRNATYIVVSALVIVTAFLISNTIKITIQSRSRQIEIMRLVGASNAYIKLPFFFEGLILGFLGSVIPIFVTCFGYIYLYDLLDGKLFTNIIKLVKPGLVIYDTIIFIVVVGMVVGAFGSYRAVRKYLKV